MANLTISNINRPRAIAKEKDGIVLYWVEELGIAGIHVRGIAQLLECNPKTIASVLAELQAVTQITPFEAEIITSGGIQAVTLVTESDLPRVLRKIERSKAKEETRDRAGDVRDRLAAAGFKLLVMLELAPQQLKAQVSQHVSDLDKALELERLRVRGRELDGSMLTMHGNAWLALQGVAVAERETVVTEVVEPATGRCTRIMTADQLKRAVKERTGQKLQSMKQFTDALRAQGRDDLLIPVTRHTVAEYVQPEHLDEAIAIVFQNRQFLLGE